MPPRDTSATTTNAIPSTTSAWQPWASLGDSTPSRAYQAYYQTSTNSLHPSCATAAATDSPMEVEDNLELEELTLVGGIHDHLLEREEQQQQTRRDREMRGQNHRGDRRRNRDREDFRSRKGP